eukprot:2105161-Prymnesium_polylepis.2
MLSTWMKSWRRGVFSHRFAKRRRQLITPSKNRSRCSGVAGMHLRRTAMSRGLKCIPLSMKRKHACDATVEHGGASGKPADASNTMFPAGTQRRASAMSAPSMSACPCRRCKIARIVSASARDSSTK